jgi:hypothetical protein
VGETALINMGLVQASTEHVYVNLAIKMVKPDKFVQFGAKEALFFKKKTVEVF